MKRFLVIFALAGTLAACNNSADTTGDAKDSIDSVTSDKKEMIDSTADQQKNLLDSSAENKKDALDSAQRKDSAKKKG